MTGRKTPISLRSVAVKAASTPTRRERIRGLLHGAVLESLDQHGYAGTNIRSLAETAGVSITTIYNIYEGKDELILEALADLLSDLNVRAREEGADALDRHLRTRRSLVGQIIKTPRYAEAMAQLLYRAHPSDRIVKLMMHDLIARSREVVVDLVAEAFIRPDVDVDYLARQMAMVSLGVTLMWIKGFVAIQELTREHLRNHVDIIARVATQKGVARLRELEPLTA